TPQPSQEQKCSGDTKYAAFIRPTVGEYRDADAEKYGVSPTWPLQESRKRAEHKRTANCRDGAAPIAVHPIACESQFQRDECAAEERRTRGHPCAEHPVNRGAHCGGGEQHANPRRTEHLAERERCALRRRIHRRIRREPIDMKCFETEPHWV